MMVSGTLAIFILILTIVAISSDVARDEAGICASPGPELRNFAPAVPPRPVTHEPFFDAAGAPVKLADYQGRGLVLNFWATWCAPCIKELPALSRLKNILADDGIKVLALSLDRGGVPVVRKFYDKIGIDNLDIFIDVKGTVSRHIRTRGLPTTILIDADGIERGRVVGIAEWDNGGVVDFIRRCIDPKL